MRPHGRHLRPLPQPSVSFSLLCTLALQCFLVIPEVCRGRCQDVGSAEGIRTWMWGPPPVLGAPYATPPGRSALRRVVLLGTPWIWGVWVMLHRVCESGWEEVGLGWVLSSTPWDRLHTSVQAGSMEAPPASPQPRVRELGAAWRGFPGDAPGQWEVDAVPGPGAPPLRGPFLTFTLVSFCRADGGWPCVPMVSCRPHRPLFVAHPPALVFRWCWTFLTPAWVQAAGLCCPQASVWWTPPESWIPAQF